MGEGDRRGAKSFDSKIALPSINHAILSGGEGGAEPVFVNVKRAQDRFRGIDSASLCSLAGRYDKQACRTGTPDWESVPGSLKGLQIRAQVT